MKKITISFRDNDNADNIAKSIDLGSCNNAQIAAAIIYLLNIFVADASDKEEAIDFFISKIKVGLLLNELVKDSTKITRTNEEKEEKTKCAHKCSDCELKDFCKLLSKIHGSGGRL